MTHAFTAEWYDDEALARTCAQRPADYVPEKTQGPDGILYVKLRDEDSHIYRVLSEDERAKEVRGVVLWDEDGTA
jgi:hypothetical protein